GFPSQNIGAEDANYELSKIPVLTSKVSCALGSGRVHFALNATRAAYTADESVTAAAYGLATSYGGKLTSDLGIRAALYWGRNLAEMSLLPLSPVTQSSLVETGGYVSTRFALTESASIFGGLGHARILNPDALPPVSSNDLGAAEHW